MSRKTKTEKYMEREKKLIFSSTVSEHGPILSWGKGSRVMDVDFENYLDFTSQVGLVNTGFRPPEVEEAIKQQSDSMLTCISADFPFCNQIEVNGKMHEVSRAALAEKLIKITDKVMPFKKRVGFEVSGATAVNFALKIAKITYLRKNGYDFDPAPFLDKDIFIPSKSSDFQFSFLGFKGAFHGRHGEAHFLTNSKAVHLWAVSSSCGVGRITFPRPGVSAESVIKEAEEAIRMLKCERLPIVAFIFEPCQGEGGIIIPDAKELKKVVDFMKEKGIYVIADEVQTGFGRTGKMFACEHFGIEPDMIVLSKSLAAGLPMGVVVANAEKFPDLESGMHSGSHHCTPVACAAAIVNIDIVKRNLKNAEKMGKFCLEELQKIAKTYPSLIEEVRGPGLMLGIEFHGKEQRSEVIELACEEGLMLAPAGLKTIRFYPPLIVDKDDLQDGLEILEKALAKATGKKKCGCGKCKCKVDCNCNHEK